MAGAAIGIAAALANKFAQGVKEKVDARTEQKAAERTEQMAKPNEFSDASYSAARDASK